MAMLEEVVVTYMKVLLQHLPDGLFKITNSNISHLNAF